MHRFNLDQKDRLFLANQYLILEKLYPEKSKTFSQFRNIVEEGFEYDYSTLLENSGIDAEGTVSSEISKEVYSIFEMYSRLQHAYAALEDKTGIEERLVIFNGFDGNNEGKHHSYAQSLISRNRFTYVKLAKNDLNSHGEMLVRYSKMLDVWNKFKNQDRLSKDQIIAIVNP